MPVPVCLAFDQATGIMLCEDLGDRLLHAALEQCTEADKHRYYREAIAALVRLQVEGRKGFDPPGAGTRLSTTGR